MTAVAEHHPALRTGESVRLLVVEDDVPLTWFIKDLLAGTRYETRLVFSVEQAEVMLKENPFDLLLLDISLPGEDGLSFYRRKRETLPPTLLMSAVNRSVVYTGELPLSHFLPKPFTPDELLRRLHLVLDVEESPLPAAEPAPAAAAVRERTTRSGEVSHVLLVEDDPILAELLQDLLSAEGYRVTRVGTLAGARDKLELAPDIIILDGILPDGDGLFLMDEIRTDPRHADRPILILSARAQPLDKAAGLLTGADDYISKPFVPEELLARVQALLRRVEACTDANPLTGLPGNRRIQQEIEMRLARPEEFDVLYVDIDHFKSFNDRYGFAIGDDAIRMLAECLRRSAGPGDFVGHIGGDDFIGLFAVGAAEERAIRALKEFSERAHALHSEEEIRSGTYASMDRQGRLVKRPLLSATGAVISTRTRRVKTYAELGQIAAELKSAARRAGEMVHVERRTA